MKYGPNIIHRITEELKKVPNIRHVAAKVGIDHSTFYRWLEQHPEFHKAIEASLMIGRERITDAAESVIINGINTGDMRASTFWLKHNEARYIEPDRVMYFQYLEKARLMFLRNPTPDESIFGKLFEAHLDLEQNLGKKDAIRFMAPLIEIGCHFDPSLTEVYEAAYEEWKTDTLKRKKIVKELDPHNRLSKSPDGKSGDSGGPNDGPAT